MKWKSKPFTLEKVHFGRYMVSFGHREELIWLRRSIRNGTYRLEESSRGSIYITKSPYTDDMFIGYRHVFVTRICERWVKLFGILEPGMIRAKLVRVTC